MKKPKTPSYTLKAVSDYQKRNIEAGLVRYSRYVKLEWKEVLDKALNELREELISKRKGE